MPASRTHIHAPIPQPHPRRNALFRGQATLLIWTVICLVCFPMVTTGCGGTSRGAAGRPAAPNATPPKAFFPLTAYHFGAVMEGEIVTYGFDIENQGGAPLVVAGVQPDPGCAVTAVPGPIPAGGRDRIGVRIDTAGSGGQEIVKYFEVLTNDPTQPRVTTALRVRVERYVTLIPDKAQLSGPAGAPVTCRVYIRPHPEYPFTVKEARAVHGNDFTFTLIPTAAGPNQLAYELEISRTRQTPGVIADFITLSTDNPAIPSFRIPVMGQIPAGK